MPSHAIIYEAAAARNSIECFISASREMSTSSSRAMHARSSRSPEACNQAGIDTVELCGGISPSHRPKVAAAFGPGVFVSSVTLVT